jgi:hypothetical protein
VSSAPPPIFVVGTKRSGTTLLQAALGAHPAIAGPPETHYIFRIADLADYYGDLTDEDRLRRALREALDTVLLSPLQLDEDAVLAKARRTPTYAGLFDAIMTTFADRVGKQRWSDKTPDQDAAAAWRLFPDALVVHIIRDPRDVVASRLQTPIIDSDSATVLAEWWRRFNLRNIEAGAAAGPSRYLRIRYEDLVRDPEATLRLVCAFVGEEFALSMISDRRDTAAVSEVAWWQERAREPIDPTRVGRHVDALSRRDRALVAAVVHHDLPALGYASPSRRLVALGQVLRASQARPSLPRRAKPVVLTPEERYELVQQYLAAAVAVSSSPQPDRTAG